MTDKRVTVVARIRAKEGQEEKVKETLLSLVQLTCAEPGCINYHLHQAVEDKGLFMFYENWTNRKALDEHMAMPYLKAFMGKAVDILAGPVDITFWEMLA